MKPQININRRIKNEQHNGTQKTRNGIDTIFRPTGETGIVRILMRSLLLFLCLNISSFREVYAQDPVLPPTNLGLANVYDGMAGKPGLIYQGYTQFFQTHQLNNGSGQNTQSNLKVNSLLQMNQLIYLSQIRIFNGNLGFTVLVPIVQINAGNLTGSVPMVNPGVLGDIVQGMAIQWSDKHLFGKPFSHRLEFDVNIPAGSYRNRYNINSSSHLWAYGIYHAFTLVLNNKVSLSSRNQFNYNGQIMGKKEKPGAYYNGNYSIDYSLIKHFKIEAAAYFLTQFSQDSYNGDRNYYRNTYGIENSKERVFGYGPGLVWFLPNGVLAEAKVFFETAAKNRFEGSRPTLRLAIPLSK